MNGKIEIKNKRTKAKIQSLPLVRTPHGIALPTVYNVVDARRTRVVCSWKNCVEKAFIASRPIDRDVCQRCRSARADSHRRRPHRRRIATRLKTHTTGLEFGKSSIQDGITNKLIGVFDDSCPEDDGVLVRVYGKNTDQIIDRQSEFKNFKLLNDAGYAPDIYATFENGMAYKYVRGETLTTTTVRDPSVYRLVAKTMAKFHRLDVSNDVETTESGLWTKIDQFANLIPERFSSPSADLQFRKIFTRGVDGLRAEIETLKAALENVNSPVVFCHNDLLLTNIILQMDTAAGGQPVNVVFIDYEYAMLNNQAFDIANHFIEFAGVQEPNFSLYPNVELQLDWLTSYLREYLGEPQLDKNDPKVATIRKQVDLFAIASHLFWIFWSLVQAEFSEIDFDYLRILL